LLKPTCEKPGDFVADFHQMERRPRTVLWKFYNFAFRFAQEVSAIVRPILFALESCKRSNSELQKQFLTNNANTYKRRKAETTGRKLILTAENGGLCNAHP